MIIKIGNREYIGQCNALSYIFYERIFKINVFEELENLRNYLMGISENNLNEKDIVNFYEILIKLIYVLMYSKNQDIEDYESFKKTIFIEDLTEDLIDKIIQTYIDSFTNETVVEELEKIPNDSQGRNVFPEHGFLKMCLDCGLTIRDLEQLTYIDVIKIFIASYTEKHEKKVTRFREATQADWDRLALM